MAGLDWAGDLASVRGLGSRAVWFGFWSLTCESDWKGYAGGVLWLGLAFVLGLVAVCFGVCGLRGFCVLWIA